MSFRITDKCVGCTICKKNCPVGAIKGELREFHFIDTDVCIDCGLCGKLCPREAILDQYDEPVKKVPEAEWKKPEFSRDICVGCSLCVESCPKECLEIEDARFHGDIETIARLADPDKCIGCGICERECPVDAVKLK